MNRADALRSLQRLSFDLEDASNLDELTPEDADRIAEARRTVDEVIKRLEQENRAAWRSEVARVFGRRVA